MSVFRFEDMSKTILARTKTVTKQEQLHTKTLTKQNKLVEECETPQEKRDLLQEKQDEKKPIVRGEKCSASAQHFIPSTSASLQFSGEKERDRRLKLMETRYINLAEQVKTNPIRVKFVLHNGDIVLAEFESSTLVRDIKSYVNWLLVERGVDVFEVCNYHMYLYPRIKMLLGNRLRKYAKPGDQILVRISV